MTYSPTAIGFVADYYTTPDEWLLDAAFDADAGDAELTELFADLISASVAAENGGSEEAVNAAESALESAAQKAR